MSIFKEIKEHLTAREVAEYYGLKVGRNGMVCCPFHDDKHPSLKIDTGYHCFGCGAHGDAIGYVAQMYGLTQYDAACKIVEDFRLPIELHPVMDPGEREKARMEWRRQKEDQEKVIHIKERFNRWCNSTVKELQESCNGIQRIKESFCSATEDEVFSSPELETAVKAEPVVNYWLDVICLGTEEEKIELFTKGRGEVKRGVERIAGAVERRLGKGRADTGFGMQHCG